MGKQLFATPRRCATLLLVAGMGLAGSTSATLFDRGGGLVYDDVLDITWLQDANYAKTSGFDADGLMTWADASAWAAGLSYFDSVRNVAWAGWRLPYASVSSRAGPITSLIAGQICSGLPAGEVACRDNEMGYMFYYNLDGTHGSPELGTQIGDGVTLNNIQHDYWSGTQYDSSWAWADDFIGNQGIGIETRGDLASWAVRPGDVAAVPEPATLALLGVGLAGLGFSRRKR